MMYVSVPFIRTIDYTITSLIVLQTPVPNIHHAKRFLTLYVGTSILAGAQVSEQA